MSWKTINRIIGLASINPIFREQLQQDPQAALETEGFKLTQTEMEMVRSVASLPFTQFCQCLQERLAPEE
ncbi:MAG TPA: Os1348 family NHLP clan protein [Ktedonobacteraceae bacterium]|nr:Os1348 family NHLP clan protein [Ktedonobacteraceae bacterium]